MPMEVKCQITAEDESEVSISFYILHFTHILTRNLNCILNNFPFFLS
jgi:hypothetical protein